MDQVAFELVFEGQIVDGVALETVKANMARLFKASDEKIGKMFSAGRIVLKNRLDKATALKYQAVLRKNGAICKIAIMKPADSGPSSPTQEANQTTAHSAAAKATFGNTRVTGSSPSDRSRLSDLKPGVSTEMQSGRLPVAGERVDTILADRHIEVAPLGAMLAEKKEVEVPEFYHLDEISIAPAGSDLGQIKKENRAVVPDISHIKLDEIG
ncbi:MAG: hypothetical protein CSB48_11030 [Proteobacteria bacterium]|nr:MAG: hypothetical protein CSB48_11030 [Pseudomonadota bacterium]PIE40071.1 MAG: hypothetical protein CSA51_02790 [Gammaproteobacteria bacterium]